MKARRLCKHGNFDGMPLAHFLWQMQSEVSRSNLNEHQKQEVTILTTFQKALKCPPCAAGYFLLFLLHAGAFMRLPLKCLQPSYCLSKAAHRTTGGSTHTHTHKNNTQTCTLYTSHRHKTTKVNFEM